jgi:hypothetical protein
MILFYYVSHRSSRVEQPARVAEAIFILPATPKNSEPRSFRISIRSNDAASCNRNPTPEDKIVVSKQRAVIIKELPLISTYCEKVIGRFTSVERCDDTTRITPCDKIRAVLSRVNTRIETGFNVASQVFVCAIARRDITPAMPKKIASITEVISPPIWNGTMNLSVARAIV